MKNKKEIIDIVSKRLNEVDSLLLEKAKADAKANKQHDGKFLNLVIKS